MLSSNVSKITLNGDGANKAFPFSFKVWDSADLRVVITDANGEDTPVSNWSAVILGLGGTVTYPTSGNPLPAGSKITIMRNMDFLQDVDLISATRWDPEVVETALDRLTAQDQLLLEKMNRALTLGVTSNLDPTAVVEDLFNARDRAESAADRAESAATTSAYYTHEGTLLSGQDTITLPWAYDTSIGVEVYLGGVILLESEKEYTGLHSVKVVPAVQADTQFKVISTVGAVSGLDSLLAGPLGSTLVGHGASTVKAELDIAKAALATISATVDMSTEDAYFKGDLYVKGPSSVIGYGNGSGGTVTQSNNKTTSVALNKGSGAITMHAASLAGGGTVSFVLNSNLINAMDVVVVGIAHNSVGDSSFYNVWASAYNGGAVITLQNISGGALSENVVLNFAVIKGYQS